MMKLSRQDTMAAISNGVHRAFYEALTSGGRFDLPHELICDAIRHGTRDAILRLSADGFVDLKTKPIRRRPRTVVITAGADL
jgi:hypothetical protein